MSIKTLKSIARRGSYLAGAFTVLAALIIPSGAAFADSLNPLTKRSLLLSSSAPGYTDTDGSGNSTDSQNSINENYAPAGTGPNGKKSGEVFTFNVSTDSTNRPLLGFTLQYCTNAAGNCQAPGDNEQITVGNLGDARNPGLWDASTNATGRPSNAQANPLGKSDFDVVTGASTAAWSEGAGAGQYQVLVDGTPSTGWEMTTKNAEDNAHSGKLTGKNNFIYLAHTGGGDGAKPTSGQTVKLVFKASESSYITNPGSGSFFVKINTFDTATTTDMIPTQSHNVDGGVTVANVMTDSIHITTKVLETMSFSVGTRNRDTLPINCGAAYGTGSQPAGCEAASGQVHGKCDAIQNVNNNRLNLGNPDAEYSLETGRAWEVASYWRLSSNSSGGATVYYSGDTLHNTVGDKIDQIGATKLASTPGTEQFGLAFGDIAGEAVDTNASDFVTGYVAPRLQPFNITTDPASAQYNGAVTGTIFTPGSGGQPNTAGTALFAFQEASSETPVAIAQQSTEVISCATAKMRYVANIGADTPAGVYTTKINYLAAPQY